MQRLREVEGLSRRVQSVMLDEVAEIDSWGVAGRAGFGAATQLLANARMRMEHPSVVGTQYTLTGETLPPRLSKSVVALAAGEIGTGQLRLSARP